MTRRGFDEACKRFMAMRGKGGRVYGDCDVCRGAVLPEHITIIELTKEQKELAMGTVKREPGFCELCGKGGNMANQYGKAVCASCQIVRIAAKNRPEVVIAALEEFEALPLPVQVGEDAKEVWMALEELQRKYSAAEEEMFELRKQHTAALEELQGKHNEAVARLEEVNDQYNQSIDDRVALEEQLMAIRQRTECTLDSRPDPKLVDLAWKLVEGVVAGTVTGIDIEDIRVLRGVVSPVESVDVLQLPV